MSLLSAPLACPVRRCHLALQPLARVWACSRGHTFDVARSGYINLLQPQDRRSPHAGDTAEAVAARRRVLDSGIGAAILHAFVSRADRLVRGRDPVVADLGCGAGDALGLLHANRPVIGVGLDLSTAAMNVAARRFAALTWVVANADRTLPLLDARVSLVLSLHARRNPDECRRVLSPGGHLLAAVPAADDLIELREAVQGSRVERDRVDDLIAQHETLFEVIDRFGARERHQLSGDQLRNVLRGTYRGERASDAMRVQALGTLTVTFASDMIVLRRR